MKKPFSKYKKIGWFYLPQSEQQRKLDEMLRNEIRLAQYKRKAGK
jgi:hypothetical protein